jgi:hypothetical protein
MNIWDENKLFLFIAFVVPGFIAIKIYDLISPSRPVDSSKKIIDAVSYSCINYALLFGPIYLIETTDINTSHPILYAGFYMFVLFLFPVTIVFFWKFLREMEWVQGFAPHPTTKPWDFVFAQRETYWIVVTIKNGDKIGGMYGPNSFASSAPAEEQIYLEEQWLLNEEGGFERAVEQTSGIIILSSEILSVELRHSGESDDE